jgi:hypothetical protein
VCLFYGGQACVDLDKVFLYLSEALVRSLMNAKQLLQHRGGVGVAYGSDLVSRYQVSWSCLGGGRLCLEWLVVRASGGTQERRGALVFIVHRGRVLIVLDVSFLIKPILFPKQIIFLFSLYFLPYFCQTSSWSPILVSVGERGSEERWEPPQCPTLGAPLAMQMATSWGLFVQTWQGHI